TDRSNQVLFFGGLMAELYRAFAFQWSSSQHISIKIIQVTKSLLWIRNGENLPVRTKIKISEPELLSGVGEREQFFFAVIHHDRLGVLARQDYQRVARLV